MSKRKIDKLSEDLHHVIAQVIQVGVDEVTPALLEAAQAALVDLVARAPRTNLIILTDALEEIDDETTAYFMALYANLPEGCHVFIVCLSSENGNITSTQRANRLRSILPADTEAIDIGVPRNPDVNAYTIHTIEEMTQSDSIIYGKPGDNNVVLQIGPIHHFGAATLECMAAVHSGPEKMQVMTSMATAQTIEVVKCLGDYHYILLGKMGTTVNSKNSAMGPARILSDGAMSSAAINSATVPKFTPNSASLFGEILHCEIVLYAFKSIIGIPAGDKGILNFIIHLSGGPALEPDGKTLKDPIVTFNGSRPAGGAKYEAIKNYFDKVYGEGSFDELNIDNIVQWDDGSKMSYKDKAIQLLQEQGVNFEHPFVTTKQKELNQNMQSQIIGCAKTLAATHYITDESLPAQNYNSNSLTIEDILGHPILSKSFEKFKEIIRSPEFADLPMSMAYDLAAGIYAVEFINGNRPGQIDCHDAELVNWTNDQAQARDSASISRFMCP